MPRYALLLLLATPLGACTAAEDLPEGCDALVEPGADDDQEVQTMFLDAREGDTVCLGEGTFNFTRELTLSTNDVTVRGMGQDQTILEFGAQDFGGVGIKISSNGVTVEELTVQNTPGDGLFAKGVDDITFRNVTVLWEELMGENNGAYALYPVACDGVLIEGCTVIGSRDAGIYVGQSNNILVQNNVAHDNVIGVEIENSFDAVVRGNEMYDNTGGILISNLPGLQQQNGERTLVHDNDIHDNNVPNWGETGTAVAEVPQGTGVIVLASDFSEVRENDIHDNDSIGVVLVSYVMLDLTKTFATEYPNFDGYAEGNYVHHNALWANGGDPDPIAGNLIPGIRPVPPLVFDGCFHPDHDAMDTRLTNCMVDNADQDGNASTFFNFDLCGAPAFQNPSEDITPHMCQHDELVDPHE